MSRKTRIAIPPGTELDPDNEDHVPYILEEAYAEMDKHPKPTRTPPERSRWWWFWRAFGFFIYRPARSCLLKYLSHRYVPPVYGENGRPSYDVYAWPFASALDRWIKRGPRRGSSALWLRTLLDWLSDIHRYSTCGWCGSTDYDSEITIYDDPEGDGRDIDMSEFLEGGGVDYWGEGQDAYGWKWCYRCGAVEWDVL